MRMKGNKSHERLIKNNQAIAICQLFDLSKADQIWGASRKRKSRSVKKKEIEISNKWEDLFCSNNAIPSSNAHTCDDIDTMLRTVRTACCRQTYDHLLISWHLGWLKVKEKERRSCEVALCRLVYPFRTLYYVHDRFFIIIISNNCVTLLQRNGAWRFFEFIDLTYEISLV